GAGVLLAREDLLELVAAGDEPGLGSGPRGRPIAALADGSAAPAVGIAGRLEGTGVEAPRGEPLVGPAPEDLGREVGIIARAEAELAVRAAAPAEGLAFRAEGAGVRPADGHLDEPFLGEDPDRGVDR